MTIVPFLVAFLVLAGLTAAWVLAPLLRPGTDGEEREE